MLVSLFFLQRWGHTPTTVGNTRGVLPYVLTTHKTFFRIGTLIRFPSWRRYSIYRSMKRWCFFQKTPVFSHFRRKKIVILQFRLASKFGLAQRQVLCNFYYYYFSSPFFICLECVHKCRKSPRPFFLVKVLLYQINVPEAMTVFVRFIVIAISLNKGITYCTCDALKAGILEIFSTLT